MTYIDYLYYRTQLGATPSDELGRALAAGWRGDPPFYGVVMVALARADTTNRTRLVLAFPDTWQELRARYDAPLGLLASDPPELRRRVVESLGVNPEHLPAGLRAPDPSPQDSPPASSPPMTDS